MLFDDDCYFRFLPRSRAKMGENIGDPTTDFQGLNTIKGETSFLMITSLDSLGGLITASKFYKRDLDILEEPLGTKALILSREENYILGV